MVNLKRQRAIYKRHRMNQGLDHLRGSFTSRGNARSPDLRKIISAS